LVPKVFDPASLYKLGQVCASLPGQIFVELTGTKLVQTTFDPASLYTLAGSKNVLTNFRQDCPENGKQHIVNAESKRLQRACRSFIYPAPVESLAGAVRRSAEAIRNNFFANGANSSKELKSGFAPRVLYLCGSPREFPEKKPGAYGARNRKLWQTRPKCFEARQGLPILVP
jgi:hypothetical protein